MMTMMMMIMMNMSGTKPIYTSTMGKAQNILTLYLCAISYFSFDALISVHTLILLVNIQAIDLKAQ